MVLRTGERGEEQHTHEHGLLFAHLGLSWLPAGHAE